MPETVTYQDLSRRFCGWRLSVGSRIHAGGG